METREGMWRAFLIRALPILLSLGLPLIELPDANSLGASPMNATIFRTLSHFSNRESSEKIAAMVASPIPGMDLTEGRRKELVNGVIGTS
jgi:hypothetical protein